MAERFLVRAEVHGGDDVVTVLLHVTAADEESAVAQVRAALEDRLDPSEHQELRAVRALRRA